MLFCLDVRLLSLSHFFCVSVWPRVSLSVYLSVVCMNKSVADVVVPSSGVPITERNPLSAEVVGARGASLGRTNWCRPGHFVVVLAYSRL